MVKWPSVVEIGIVDLRAICNLQVVTVDFYIT